MKILASWLRSSSQSFSQIQWLLKLTSDDCNKTFTLKTNSRSPFFWAVGTRHWVFSAQRFETTALSRNVDHKSPIETAPHRKRVVTSEMLLEKPQMQHSIALLKITGIKIFTAKRSTWPKEECETLFTYNKWKQNSHGHYMWLPSLVKLPYINVSFLHSAQMEHKLKKPILDCVTHCTCDALPQDGEGDKAQ